MAKTKSFDYSGEQATVSWHGALCIHIGECGRARGDLFVTGRKPWCQPDASSTEEVQDVVLRCPTGALSWQLADGTRPETAESENVVHIAYNGPLFARGELQIDGVPEEVPGLKFRAALCRCGQSRNKPFCDNTHEEAGFRDYGAVGDTGPGFEARGGPLRITPVKDGPLMISGNLAIHGASGRTAWRGAKAALCRCGHSKNKPFCDGQHKAAGFKSD